MTLHTRELKSTDLAFAHALNQQNVPEVGSETPARFEEIAALSAWKQVVEHEGKPIGFAFGILPDMHYWSRNYQWLNERVPSFIYIDRVAVLSEARRLGAGRLLYQQAIEAAHRLEQKALTCEVNELPPNPTSTRFHRALGFRKIGSLSFDENYRVAFFEKAL